MKRIGQRSTCAKAVSELHAAIQSQSIIYGKCIRGRQRICLCACAAAALFLPCVFQRLTDFLHITGEEAVCLAEDRLGTALQLFSLRRPDAESRYVLLALRPFGIPPRKAFHQTVLLRELDYRISVVLGLLEVVQTLQVAVSKGGRHKLCLNLIDCRKFVIFFKIEDCIHPSKSIEALEGHLVVEIGHHLGGAYLVEEETVLLYSYESIGNQVCTVNFLVLHKHKEAIGGILAPLFVPDHRVAVKAGDGVERTEHQGVAAHLHILPENPHIA